MKICAVICEYDPFHKGHAHQIAQLKSLGYSVISVMSGSFTQRGGSAVISKYKRAEAAVKCGADLVLELPFPYSASGASKFAAGGVHIASSLGCADTLAFGSECGKTDTIVNTAKNMLSPDMDTLMTEMGTAESYAKKYASAYAELFGKSDVIYGSNDLLGIEYAKAIISQNSGIKPLALKREGQSYSGEGKGFVSAAAARKSIYEGDLSSLENLLPGESFSILKSESEKGRIAEMSRLFLPYASHLRLCRPADLDGISEMNDELAGRVCAAARGAKSFAELIALAKTKLYSESRIRRAMLMACLSVKTEDVSLPSYTVLLGANGTGRKILREIERNSDFPIITKPADYVSFGGKTRADFELALRAESLWTLCLEKPEDAGYHMKFSPYME